MSIRRQPSDNQGFTLVELAIVIVILGMLIGGIMAGQSLVRASELRSVTAEIGRYMAAVNGFRDKYFALPGDMSNAESYWGSTLTKNGNGDAQIFGNPNAAAATTAATNETGHFWSQLGLSTFIEGNYTAGSWASVTATSNPKSKIGGAYWHMRHVGTVVADDAIFTAETLYEGAYGNAFFLLKSTNISASLSETTTTGVMKSEEAWSIDSKLDDGLPMSGSVVALESQGNGTAGSGCGNAAASTSATTVTAYDLQTATATACSLVFKSGL